MLNRMDLNLSINFMIIAIVNYLLVGRKLLLINKTRVVNIYILILLNEDEDKMKILMR